MCRMNYLNVSDFSETYLNISRPYSYGTTLLTVTDYALLYDTEKDQD